MWRFLGTRRVWGEDMILDIEELIDHSQAVALTYCEVYTLRRHALDVLLDDCEIARRIVFKAKRKITLQRMPDFDRTACNSFFDCLPR